MVGRGWPLQARRLVLAHIRQEYREATAEQKRRLLDRFTQMTGYHRTYACWLLNRHISGKPEPSRPRPRTHGADVQQVLVLAWTSSLRLLFPPVLRSVLLPTKRRLLMSSSTT